jgi:hypothetical protein
MLHLGQPDGVHEFAEEAHADRREDGHRAGHGGKHAGSRHRADGAVDNRSGKHRA